MVGLSLSLCIRDIILGKRELNPEDMFCVSTSFSSDSEFNEVIENYRQYYWQDNPVRAEIIVRLLREEGRIFQPREHGLQPSNIARRHWATPKQALAILHRAQLPYDPWRGR